MFGNPAAAAASVPSSITDPNDLLIYFTGMALVGTSQQSHQHGAAQAAQLALELGKQTTLLFIVQNGGNPDVLMPQHMPQQRPVMRGQPMQRQPSIAQPPMIPGVQQGAPAPATPPFTAPPVPPNPNGQP